MDFTQEILKALAYILSTAVLSVFGTHRMFKTRMNQFIRWGKFMAHRMEKVERHLGIEQTGRFVLSEPEKLPEPMNGNHGEE